jgi:hypothetical protein
MHFKRMDGCGVGWSMHKAKLKALLIGNVWETEDAS